MRTIFVFLSVLAVILLPFSSAQSALSEASASSASSASASASGAVANGLNLQSQQLAFQAANQLGGLNQSPGSSVADPLSLAALPRQNDPLATSNTLPPFSSVDAYATVSPPIVEETHTTLNLDLGQRIKQTEDLLNRMIWQLNRETAWANSVHDIIQNYQYKYSKVLSNIKKHTASAAKMRELASTLKKARLHEILEHDLAKATEELTELASTSSETSADQGSYSALKDRVALMKQDLDKMTNLKVNKVLHDVQDGLKTAAQEAVPGDSADTLQDLMLPKK